MVANPQRVTKLALLNTLVYPRPSWAVIAFVAAARTPILRDRLTTPGGLAFAMKLGMANRERLTDEVLEGVQAPFRSDDARRALLKAGTNLHPGGMREIARGLPQLEIPVRIVYGTEDRILPDVERTMEHVKRDLPQAEVSALEGCGHFLQEDEPERVGELLAEFFALSAGR